MRRRLLVTLIGVVVTGLLLAGLGTLLQARLDRQDHTRERLIDRARTATAIIDEALVAAPRNRISNDRVAHIVSALDVREFGMILVDDNRAEPLVDIAPLPHGISHDDLDLDTLFAVGSTHGMVDDRIWAAASSALPGPRQAAYVVVVTGAADDSLGDASGWFLVSGIFTVLLAAGAAIHLSRRLALPFDEAAAATRRLADGYLTARLPEPPPDATDEPSELARAINAMAAGLERSRGLERQFLLSVSHDLRTPMTSIQGYAEALLDGTLDDAARAGEVILTESRRLDRLVRDLLDLARLDARHFTLHRSPVDMVEAARRTAEAFRPAADGQGLDLVITVPTEPVPIDLDPDRWAQVGANLVENALRYARSRVAIAVRVEDGSAHLAVIDDGPGIPPDDLPHVFERLYVARQRPQESESGSGLGLAIVEQLMDAMGGRVTVESTEGSGTTFTASFPYGG